MLIIDPPATAGGTDIDPSATPDFEAKLGAEYGIRSHSAVGAARTDPNSTPLPLPRTEFRLFMPNPPFPLNFPVSPDTDSHPALSIPIETFHLFARDEDSSMLPDAMLHLRVVPLSGLRSRGRN